MNKLSLKFIHLILETEKEFEEWKLQMI
jgi:hypothetical protein